MNVHPDIDPFFTYLTTEKRYSAHTVTAYSGDLIQFRDYLITEYQISTPVEANFTLIRSWVANLMDSGVSPRSVNRKITAVRMYYRFLVLSGVLKNNPASKIQGPKSAKKLPVFVEERQMENLLKPGFVEESVLDNEDGLLARTILELFYGTGMRLSELITLKASDVQLSSRTLKVMGKRAKERIIPIPEALKDVLVDFHEKREKIQLQTGVHEENFLIRENGKKLTPGFVYKIVKRYLSLVTTLDKKSPHVLRHTFATHMLNNGADLNAIKELLGHANLSATQVYTHNTVEKLKAIYHKAHPRA